MVRLNDKQQRLIAELKTAREKQVRDNTYIDRQAAAQKLAAKAPITALIREALGAGVPARQIAVNGLGYADVNSLKQYMAPQPVVFPCI